MSGNGNTAHTRVGVLGSLPDPTSTTLRVGDHVVLDTTPPSIFQLARNAAGTRTWLPTSAPQSAPTQLVNVVVSLTGALQVTASGLVVDSVGAPAANVQVRVSVLAAAGVGASVTAGVGTLRWRSALVISMEAVVETDATGAFSLVFTWSAPAAATWLTSLSSSQFNTANVAFA